MRRVSIAVLCVVAFWQSGCSNDSPSRQFDTQGLVPPSGLCSKDARRIGIVEKIDDIDEGNGCFVANAYRVHAVRGVALNQPATLNCAVAQTFADWIDDKVQPAAERTYGERVVKVEVPSAYACRPRGNKRGAKLSEHGMGNAIDVSTFVLASGRRVTVLSDWNGARDSRNFLRQVRADACGPFKTVLGPGADAQHKDHFHLDLQHHRSAGAYCR